MRLLIDQNLPRSLARRMTDAGHAAAHTGELGLEKATDPVVFAATGDLMELSGISRGTAYRLLTELAGTDFRQAGDGRSRRYELIAEAQSCR